MSRNGHIRRAAYSTHTYDFSVADPDYELPDLSGMMRAIRAQPNPALAATLPRQFLLRVTNPSPKFYVDRGSEGMRKYPNTAERKADKYKLFQFFEDQQYQGRQMVYAYDLGDSWRDHMIVEGRAAPTADFKCISGEGHYVAEDVGSTAGWKRLKEAYRTSTPDQGQKEKRAWFEKECSNGEKEGLKGREHEFDKDLVDLVLDGMRSAGLRNDRLPPGLGRGRNDPLS